MLRFEPIKKKRAQIRILCAASATRSRSVDEEEQKKKKKKKKKREGRRKRVPFWGFAPGGRRLAHLSCASFNRPHLE